MAYYNRAQDDDFPIGQTLSYTPTWVVACVMAVFVLVSLIVERSIHLISRWLWKTKRKPLYESLEKMKEELMLLGFISLFLSFLAHWFTRICIDSSSYDLDLIPCKNTAVQKISGKGRALISLMRSGRILLSDENQDCGKGKEPFISYEDIHEVHRLLFVMAITHIFYSCMTVALALFKVYRWKRWEQEAHCDGYDSFAEITRDTPLKRQFIFALYHTSEPWTGKRFLVWLACFARQFGKSVSRADYLALRSGFIMDHNLWTEYNFHNYVVRCMEVDFTSIVGMSPPLWGVAVVFILFNVNGSNLYFWVAFIPMIVVLGVGTKLQHVIATLTAEKLHSGVKLGRQPHDRLFWFRNPEFLLWLLHFILFQNAFELATFLWAWLHLADHACMMRSKKMVFIRLVSGAAVQYLCGYSTLPMYALVTQIGSSFKRCMISDRVRESVHHWHMDAKKRVKWRTVISLRSNTSKHVAAEVTEMSVVSSSAEGVVAADGSLKTTGTSKSIYKSPI